MKGISTEYNGDKMGIWRFPEMGCTPKSSNWIGLSIIKHSFGGIPFYGNSHINNEISPPTLGVQLWQFIGMTMGVATINWVICFLLWPYPVPTSYVGATSIYQLFLLKNTSIYCAICTWFNLGIWAILRGNVAVTHLNVTRAKLEFLIS